MIVYIAGKMRGVEEFNFPAFYFAEEHLKFWYSPDKIYNPARMDEEKGIDVTGLSGDESELEGFDLRATMKENLIAICECTHIYMLVDWENSAGARAEHALAVCLGLEIIYE